MAYSFSSYAVSRAMVLKSVLQPLPFTLNCMPPSSNQVVLASKSSMPLV